jgi:hypothetical protein
MSDDDEYLPKANLMKKQKQFSHRVLAFFENG